ncbi:MAG: DsrE family protein [Actinobacteria bacterium]|nr:DsrE family protein [Actinomycetota bacterium]
MDNEKRMTIVVRRGPYGTIDAAEAIRHAAGGLNFKVPTTLLLMEDGVFVARREQLPEGIGYLSLSRALEEYLARRGRGQEGEEIAGRVVVHAPSARERGLSPDDLIAGVSMVEEGESARLLADSGWTLVY